jgi:hypothetical protein
MSSAIGFLDMISKKARGSLTYGYRAQYDGDEFYVCSDSARMHALWNAGVTGDIVTLKYSSDPDYGKTYGWMERALHRHLGETAMQMMVEVDSKALRHALGACRAFNERRIVFHYAYGNLTATARSIELGDCEIAIPCVPVWSRPGTIADIHVDVRFMADALVGAKKTIQFGFASGYHVILGNWGHRLAIIMGLATEQ